MRGLCLLFVVGAVALSGSSSSSCKKTLTTTKHISVAPATVTKTKRTTVVEDYRYTEYAHTVTTTSYYDDVTTIYPTPATITFSETTTSYSTSSTIAAPTGFIPVQSSLPGSRYEDIYGLQDPDQALAERAVERIVARAAEPAKYPKPTYCATKTVTITSRPARVTTTSTKTVTSTLQGVVTLSGTYTDTTYQPNPTVTKTYYQNPLGVTVTSTATGSSTSFYAACATQYWTNSYDYQGFDAGLLGAYEKNGKQPDDQYIDFNVTNMYECCVNALNKSDKRSSIWLFFRNPSVLQENPEGVFGDYTNCRVYTQPTDVCAATGQNTTNWQFPIYSGAGPALGYVAGNGWCGNFDDVYVVG